MEKGSDGCWCDKRVGSEAYGIKKNVQALYLDIHAQDSPNVIVQSEEISRFEHLRFLNLSRGIFVGNFKNHLTELRWLSWNFPLEKNEWTNLYLKNMVILKLSGDLYLDDSRLQDLIQMARKLKVLSLQDCAEINGTLDFSRCPDLERLAFESCSNLWKIDGSIGKLKCLIDLKIKHCVKLKYLPEEIGYLVNLKQFA